MMDECRSRRAMHDHSVMAVPEVAPTADILILHGQVYDDVHDGARRAR